jgi:MFS family permease
VSATAVGDDSQTFVRAQLRHNLAALGVDFALFMVGLSFASQATILPAFAVHLGAPNVVIGAIPAVMTAGWLLPSLFAAGHTETLERRLPFVVRYTIWERVPFLFMAAIAFFVADRSPALALLLLLGSLLVLAGFGGLLMPAWMDVVGRTVPTTLRGRFFAITSAASSLAGLLGGIGTAWILGAVAAPASFGICFLIASVFMGLSFVALVLVREPPARATAEPTPLGVYLRRMPALLRRDTNFSWYVVARALGLLSGMGAAFYTVYALSAHGASVRHVGYFTTALYAGQIAGTLAFGWLADRAGHRVVIVIGVATLALANAAALAVPDVLWFNAVFVLNGLTQGSINVSNMNILLEFAPTTEERPTYVGLGNTLAAPFAFAAPLIAGIIADGIGFTAVFVASIVAGLAAVLLMLLRVREPRQ